MPTPHPRFAVILPVKPPHRGKSRLVGIDDDRRAALARAFALDTAEACLATPSVAAVLAVTDDVRFSFELGALGCDAIPDGVSGDLNESLRQAAAEVVRRWPGLVPVALCGDLPALRPADLDAALSSIVSSIQGSGPSYVVDAAGTGTTLYTAAYERFTPSFGVDSAHLHREGGAMPVPGDLPSLRQDVDTVADLRVASGLGLGHRTMLAALEAGLLG